MAYGPADVWAHARLYGDPAHYLGPALFDIYGEIFRSRSLQNPTQSGTFRTTISCYAENCSEDSPYVCVDDAPDAMVGVDTNGDGTLEIHPGDVVYFGDPYAVNARPPKVRTHVVVGTINGTGGNGCAASEKRLEVLGQVRVSEEAIVAGAFVVNAWSNRAHPTTGAAFLMGYRLGFLSRALAGQQGPNLVRNGSFDFPSLPSPPNWSTDDLARHPLDQLGYPAVNPVTEAGTCITGQRGTGDCGVYAAPYPGWIRTDDPVTIQPRGRYVYSAWVMPHALAGGVERMALVDGSGLEIPGSDLALTPDLLNRSGGVSARLYKSVQIPSETTSARLIYRKGDSTSSAPTVDDVSLRELFIPSLDASDSPTSSFVINDPGDRVILFTGDSWTEATHGEGLVLGLRSALHARLGRDLGNQVRYSGHSGDTTADLLAHWTERVTAYEPLYCVFSIGTNDSLIGRDEGAFEADLREIVRRSQCEGCVPVFLSVPPVNDSGGTRRMTAYRFRELEARVLADATVGPPPHVVGLRFVSREVLAWELTLNAATWDVARGDLEVGRMDPEAECLGRDLTATTITDATTPHPGRGFYYVIRARGCNSQSGTWDDLSQEGTRDPMLTPTCD